DPPRKPCECGQYLCSMEPVSQSSRHMYTAMSTYLPRSLWRTTAAHATKHTTAAKELGEQVLGGHATHAGTLSRKTLSTILVIDPPLFRVAQDFICMTNLCKTSVSLKAY